MTSGEEGRQRGIDTSGQLAAEPDVAHELRFYTPTQMLIEGIESLVVRHRALYWWIGYRVVSLDTHTVT